MSPPTLGDPARTGPNPEPHRMANSNELRRAVIDRRSAFVEQLTTHADPTWDAVVRRLTKPSSMKIISVDENEQPTAIHLDQQTAAGLIDYLAGNATVRPTRTGRAWRAFYKENNPTAVEFGDRNSGGAHTNTTN